MATQQAVVSVSIPAAGDLSTKQYTFVLTDNTGKVTTVASAGGDADGVQYNAPSAAGQATEVAISGIVKVVAGDDVTAGDKIQSDNAGRAITAASGDHVLGKAITGGAVNEKIEVLLVNHHILA